MWVKRVVNGEARFVGAIGDQLRIRVVATFVSPEAEPVDFTDHTWLAQIRRRTNAGLFATLDLIEDNSTFEVGSPTNLYTVDLLYGLDNTTGFLDGVRYLYGVKAISGDLAPYTLVRADPIYGYEVVPHE